MLRGKVAMATVAVLDLPAARKFYEEKLGLEVAETEGDEAVSYKSGETGLLVYQSSYAGANKATAVTWMVGKELERIVASLKERGISFKHYDLPGMTQEGDLHVGGGMKVAWFTDPDGNIHSLVNG